MPAISNITLSSVTSDLVFRGGDTLATLKLAIAPRAKVMRLRVDPRTAEVLLTVPRRVSRKHALEWAAGHRSWIEHQLSQIEPAGRLGGGAELRLYDLPHVIDWNSERPRKVTIEPGRIVVGGPLVGLEARLLRWLKSHALEVLSTETGEYASKAGVVVKSVSIGDPRSRWGSCSSSGAIRYSWRLILAPEWVRRATVAHEVAHRVHMNHGPHFHALVANLFEGDPGKARAWLKLRGAALHRIAA